MAVTLSLSGFGDWLNRMGQAAASIDLQPALRIAAVMCGAAIKENFVRESDPSGRPWAPLKRSRRNSKGKDEILQDTRAMMASFGLLRLAKTEMDYGSNVDRALWHQHGTKKMVARPIVGVTAALAEKVAKVVAEQVIKQLGTVK